MWKYISTKTLLISQSLVKKLLLGTAIVICSLTVNANTEDKNAINSQYSAFYMVVNGKTVTLGDSIATLMGKFGQPNDSQFVEQQSQGISSKKIYTWYYDDGLRFTASIDMINEAVVEMTLSSSNKNSHSFAMVSEVANPLNVRTINNLEVMYKNNPRCLSFFEQDGVGWLDYVVQDTVGSNQLAIFSAINATDKSLIDKQVQQQTKQVAVDSITLTYNRESLSQDIYCKR